MTPEESAARITALENQLTEAKNTAAERKAELTRVQGELTRTTNRADAAESRVSQLEADATAATEAHAQALQQAQAASDERFAAAQKDVVSAELRIAAFAAGMVAPDDITRFVDVGTIERDADGKLVGIAEAVNGLKTDRAYLFQAPASGTEQTQTGNPDPGTTSPGQRRATPPAPGQPQTVANLDESAYAAQRDKLVPGYRRQ